MATVRLLIFASVSLCSFPSNVVASTDFSDPAIAMEMASEWVDKPVTYDDKNSDADMVVTLGQQTSPALKDFIAEYAKAHGLKIALEQGSCGVTAKKIQRKAVDIGAYCCPPGKTDRLPGVVFHTIGIAPIALVTRPDNPVENVTLQEARGIFSGSIINWSEVPSSDKKLHDVAIQPVARLHCKKRPGHWKGLLEHQDSFGPKVREVGVIPDMISNVAMDDRSIGMETLFMLEVYKNKGELKALSVDGMHPSDLDRMIDASYPFYRNYSLTTWSDDSRSKEAEALVEAVQRYIESDGERLGIVPASKLRQAGWKFSGDELIGEPDGGRIFTEHDHDS